MKKYRYKVTFEYQVEAESIGEARDLGEEIYNNEYEMGAIDVDEVNDDGFSEEEEEMRKPTPRPERPKILTAKERDAKVKALRDEVLRALKTLETMDIER